MRAPVLCFALKLMRIPMKPLLALLLAVLLPVRGFTSATHCEPRGQGHARLSYLWLSMHASAWRLVDSRS